MDSAGPGVIDARQQLENDLVLGLVDIVHSPEIPFEDTTSEKGYTNGDDFNNINNDDVKNSDNDDDDDDGEVVLL